MGRGRDRTGSVTLRGWLHPSHGWLLLTLVAVVLLSQLEPLRDRRQALAQAHARDALRGPAWEDLEPEAQVETPVPLRLVQVPEVFEPWFLDRPQVADVCAFDGSLDEQDRLSISTQRFKNGLEIFLAPQDLAFLAWTAFTYDLNPHFLLGVMMAESAGDCSAVSGAGAQGCFQITYTMGAGQLRNSFPERVRSWYWAPRSNVGGVRRSGEALGYWPSDLYISPEEWFGRVLPRGLRQLRMTLDPVATLQTSERSGDTEVSSVANFSFGVIGSGLYFHFLNYYLYAHLDSQEEELRALLNVPGEKVRWMAAAYNQGAPRTMRTLGRYGAELLWERTLPEVEQYADVVSSFCEQLQMGRQTYGGTMTWGEFSDWLENLRWTYSELPIDWILLQEQIKARHFAGRAHVDLETELLSIFHTLRSLEPRLGPEVPVVDHRVKF